MSTQRPPPGEPWPGWTASDVAQAPYGKHLVRIGQLIPAVLYAHVMGRQGIAAARNAGRQDVFDAQVASIVMECRDDSSMRRSS